MCGVEDELREWERNTSVSVPRTLPHSELVEKFRNEEINGDISREDCPEVGGGRRRVGTGARLRGSENIVNEPIINSNCN